jgi:predicted HTH domain antitoxin
MSDTFQYTVTLPRSAKPHLEKPEQETKRLIAMDLYKKGGVSVAWAAAVAGMNRMAFASLLVDNNIPIRQQTVEEVMADVASLEELPGK